MIKYLFLLILTAFLFIPGSILAQVSGNNNVAILNIISEKNNFTTIGEIFNADIKVDTENIGANAIQATVYFPKDIIEVVSYDKTGSAINLWLEEPSFSNETGKITFTGGATTSFYGKNIQILKIAFRIKGSGTGQIGFTDGAVTASDGSGTNILSEMNGFEIISVPAQKITEIKITSSTIKNLSQSSNKPVASETIAKDQNAAVKTRLISALGATVDLNSISNDNSFFVFSIKLTKNWLMGILTITSLLLGIIIGRVYHLVKIRKGNK